MHHAIDVLDRLDRIAGATSRAALRELGYQLRDHRRATRRDLSDIELLGLLADLAADGLLRAGKITWKGRRALESAPRDCTGRIARPYRQTVPTRRAA